MHSGRSINQRDRVMKRVRALSIEGSFIVDDKILTISGRDPENNLENRESMEDQEMFGEFSREFIDHLHKSGRDTYRLFIEQDGKDFEEILKKYETPEAEKEPASLVTDVQLDPEIPSSASDTDKGEICEQTTMEPIFLYEGEQIDVTFLEKLNYYRNAKRMKSIDKTDFFRLLNEFEITTYMNVQLDLVSPLIALSWSSPTNEPNEYSFCEICFQPESTSRDQLIFCRLCNVCVHKNCYGASSAKAQWCCRPCLNLKSAPSADEGSSVIDYARYAHVCELCPIFGGAMKLIKEKEQSHLKRFAHISCVLYMPGMKFGDTKNREKLSGLLEVDEWRWKKRCGVCNLKLGACIKCSVEGCNNYFHVTCGLRNGQILMTDIGADLNTSPQITLCAIHSHEIDVTNDVVSPIEFNKYTEMEKHFFCYVDPNDISKKLNLETDIVSDVYEFWKMRRLMNGGKPLINCIGGLEKILTRKIKERPPRIVAQEDIEGNNERHSLEHVYFT